LEKTNVTWNQNNTITFRKLRRWYFDAETSNGSLNDNITTLNPLAVVRFSNTIKKIYLKKTVIIWEKY